MSDPTTDPTPDPDITTEQDDPEDLPLGDDEDTPDTTFRT